MTPDQRIKFRRRMTAFLAAGSSVMIFVIFMTGFLLFVTSIPAKPPALMKNADGAVALTGGASRIASALDLLQQQKAKRLLISGVFPKTTIKTLNRKYPGHNQWFDCCVDLDHKAHNTASNAIETASWARANNINTLIVVTGSYHMPRSLAELRHALPGVKLIQCPVIPAQAEPSLQLLMGEYIKYILALIRIHILPFQQ